MRDLAKKASIDEASVCQYVVNGLPNTPNKLLLYGCNNFKELKQKLLLFEKLHFPNQSADPRSSQKHFNTTSNFSQRKSDISKQNSASSTVANENIICFKCGDKNHVASSCVHKQIRCFYCKNFGHKIFNCPKKHRNQANHSDPKPSDSNVNQVITNLTPPSLMTLQIAIGHISVIALVDSGSQSTIFRESVYKNIGSPPLQPTSSTLTGLGSHVIRPIGSFHTQFQIQNTVFNSTVYVVKDNLLSFDAILGQDSLQQAEFILSKQGIQLVEHKSCDQNFLVNVASVIENSSVPDLTHICDTDIRSEINHLISTYKPNKTKSPDIQMNIVLSDDIPVHQRPRRLPQVEQKIVNDQIQQWLDAGVIKPSCSDYSSPVVLCKKKDSSHRLCIDYRQLNKKIIRDRFPLPLIDDVIDRLETSTVFSTLDLKNGFFHVPINPNCTKFTSFVVPDGQFEFLVAPFGLCVSPNIFQRYIYAIFRTLIANKTVVIYLDDFIVPAKTESEGLYKLKCVLEVASEHGLEVNFKKCCFLKRKIDFLGYVIQNGTIQPSIDKTAAVQNFQTPHTVKQLQSFLGLTGYFRKFISKYSLIAKPLTDLLKNNTPFHFGEAQMQAFQQLKNILSQSPVLHIFKQGSKLELHTDASSHGFGSVLLQQADDEHFYPIHYMSRKTTPQQEKYSSYELEVLAIIESVKKFRTYLLGSKFTIITDCEAFQKTIHKKDVTPKVARWSLILDEFDYEIVHRPGRLMPHVDALSRHAVYFITTNAEITTKIAAAQANDEHILALKTLCQNNSSSDFFVKNDVL